MRLSRYRNEQRYQCKRCGAKFRAEDHVYHTGKPPECVAAGPDNAEQLALHQDALHGKTAAEAASIIYDVKNWEAILQTACLATQLPGQPHY